MPLPLLKKTVVVEPLPKWQKGLVVLAGVSVVVSASVSVWFSRSIRVLTGELAGREERLKSLEQEALARAEQLKTLKATLQGVKIILDQHTSALPLLTLLEEVTFPQVRWEQMEVVIDGGGAGSPGAQGAASPGVSAAQSRRLTLRGLASSFAIVAQQLERLRASPHIGELNVGRTRLGTAGRVEFSLDARLKESIWREL